MCLGKLYQASEGSRPIMENIANMRFNDDGIEIETLFGERKTISGKLREIDFVKSRIVVEN